MSPSTRNDIAKLLTIAVAVLSFNSVMLGQTYTVKEIRPLHNSFSVAAIDLNDFGYVVGNADSSDPEGHGSSFIYNLADDSTKPMATLGGPSSFVNAINNKNQVVGKSLNESFLYHAFVYEIGTGEITDLHPFVSFGGLESSAIGINENGHVVGWAEAADGQARAFVYNLTTGIRTDLGTLGGGISVAFDINDNDVVAGMAQVSSTVTHAFSYNLSTRAMTDMGTLGGNDVAVARINNKNDIIGSSTTVSTSAVARAFRSTAGRSINPVADLLPNLSSGGGGGAFGINDAGDIVGAADSQGRSKAFIRRNNVTADLNSINQAGSNMPNYGMLRTAVAINNLGQIVGNGLADRGPTGSGGRPAAFILIPNNYSVGVTGQVTAGGLPLSGVSLVLNGSVNASVTTDSSGVYTFANLLGGGSYTIIPAAQGYTFLPVTLNSLSSNRTVNFAHVAYSTIEGRVMTSSGQGLRSAVVSLTGPTGLRSLVQTSTLGYFSFSEVVPGRKYVLSVASKRFRFAPAEVIPTEGLLSVDFRGLE